MKLLHSIIILIAVYTVLSFIGCSNTSQAQPSKQPVDTTQTYNVDVQQPENSLTHGNDSSQSNVFEGKQPSDSKLGNAEIWLWCATGLVAVITLLLFAIYLKLYTNLNGRANRQRNDIEEIKIQLTQVAQRTVSRTSTSSDYESLKRRIIDLEMKVRQLTSYSRQVQQSQISVTPVVSAVESLPKKNGYFGNPVQATEPYFKKLLVSQDSEARFSVEISDDKAVFKPLNSSEYIGTFISNDAMRSAIEFTGRTPEERPTSMRVILSGEAVRRDDRWFITKKAQVYLDR